MTCPCKDCICVPVCQHKKYFMLTKCELIRDFIDTELLTARDVDDITNAVHRRTIHETLKPTAWFIDPDGWVIDLETPFYKWSAPYSKELTKK